MQTSASQMRAVENELRWMPIAWLLWGVSMAVGKWFSIDSLKPDSTDVLAWFGFAGLFMLGKILKDCTNAVVTAIQETK